MYIVNINYCILNAYSLPKSGIIIPRVSQRRRGRRAGGPRRRTPLGCAFAELRWRPRRGDFLGRRPAGTPRARCRIDAPALLPSAAERARSDWSRDPAALSVTCNEQLLFKRAHRLGRRDDIIAYIPHDADIDYITYVTKALSLRISQDMTLSNRNQPKTNVFDSSEGFAKESRDSGRSPIYFDHLTINNNPLTRDKGRLKAGQHAVGEIQMLYLGTILEISLDRHRRCSLSDGNRQWTATGSSVA